MHKGNLEKEIANQVSKLNIQKLGIEENNMTLQQYKTYKNMYIQKWFKCVKSLKTFVLLKTLMK